MSSLDTPLPPLLDPATPIPGVEDRTVADFWSWAFSDLVSNATRGVVAEYLVGVALGVVDRPRVEWDAVDLRYRGAAVEVKASGYAQSWDAPGAEPPRRSPSFSVRLTYGWDAARNTSAQVPARSADVYVFCIHLPARATPLEVLDATTWEFYVASTAAVNATLGEQKSLGLGRLRTLTQPISFEDMRLAVDAALEGPN